MKQKITTQKRLQKRKKRRNTRKMYMYRATGKRIERVFRKMSSKLDAERSTNTHIIRREGERVKANKKIDICIDR